MKDPLFSRRQFFSGFAAALFSAAVFTAGCSRKKSHDETRGGRDHDPDSCDDLTGVPETDIELRQKFAYLSESPISDNQCDNCNLYLPAKPGNKCGGCMLFKGPVEPSGYCTYWAPKV